MGRDALHIVLAILALCVAYSANALTKQGYTVGNYQLSKIGCGTWSWGNRFLWGYSEEDDAQLQETYEYITKRGVNWFDTADSYGTGSLNGRAEELLGRFERESKSKKKVCFATKLAPYPWRIGSQSMVKAGEASIERLGRPIDIVQLHWPPSLGWQEKEYLQGFGSLLQQKKATQVGVSNCGPRKLKKLCKESESNGYKIFSNQVQFSLLSRYPLENGLIAAAEDEGVHLVGYSPLALGLLSDQYSIESNCLPSGVRGILFREFLPIMTPLLQELRSIAKTRNKTVPQVALNWNICKGLSVLVGMRTVQQAKDNLGALGWSLSTPEVEALDKAAQKVPKQLVQNSFQTK